MTYNNANNNMDNNMRFSFLILALLLGSCSSSTKKVSLTNKLLQNPLF